MCLQGKKVVRLSRSLMSHLTLSGIYQRRILEWIAISFSNDPPGLGIKPTSPTLCTWSICHRAIGKPSSCLFIHSLMQ